MRSSALNVANDSVVAEARAELAMEIAGLGTFERDLQSGWMSFSDRASEIYGVGAAMPWSDWLQGVHVEDRAGLLALPFSTAVATGEGYYLVWPKNTLNSQPIALLHDFLHQHVPESLPDSITRQGQAPVYKT